MDNNSIMVVHEFTRYWNELLTWLNAVKICCKMPKVIAPAAMDGINRRYIKNVIGLNIKHSGNVKIHIVKINPEEVFTHVFK